MRVEGSSVLVTFSASYWTGIAPAGEDYGWRLVCFTSDSSDHAKASVAEADRAADRAEAVDAVNFNGYKGVDRAFVVEVAALEGIDISFPSRAGRRSLQCSPSNVRLSRTKSAGPGIAWRHSSMCTGLIACREDLPTAKIC